MVEIMHLPTIEACNEYGFARYPQGYNFQNKPDDNEPVQVPDFLRGGQFTINENKPVSKNVQPPLSTSPFSAESLESLKVDTGSLNHSYVESLKSENFKSPSSEEFSGMDEVIIDVLDNRPYIPKLRPVKENPKILEEYVEGGEERKIFTIRIAPEWDDISLERTHTWEAPGGTLSNIIKEVSGMAFFVDEMRHTINNVKQATTGGTLQAPFTKQMHIRQEYKESNKDVLVIPFTLFTKSNFERDIFFPLMFLTSLSYPRRVTSQTLIDRFIQSSENQAEKAEKDNEGPELDFTNLFKIYTPYISSPPRYLRVRHSSGLFKFNHMVITDFNYDFERPFINEIDNRIHKFSFPVKVDCTLTLKSMDYLMAGEYMSLLADDDKIEIRS